jgi:hypothetical protein
MTKKTLPFFINYKNDTFLNLDNVWLLSVFLVSFYIAIMSILGLSNDEEHEVLDQTRYKVFFGILVFVSLLQIGAIIYFINKS